MSQENVEVVRRGWDAWLRGDLPGLFRLCDPEVVWDTSHFHDWPESAYHGIEGVERFLTEWLESKLIRMDNFEDRGEALEAAGLRESWPHQQPS